MSSQFGEDYQSLISRIQRLEDIEAIRGLRFRYHRMVNDGELHRFGELFTEDAVAEFGEGSHVEGRTAIATALEANLGAIPLLKQFVHNHFVELNGDEAEGYAYFEAKYGSVDERSLVVAGRYDESYARIDGRWLIRRMIVHLYFAVPNEIGWGSPDRNVFAKRD